MKRIPVSIEKMDFRPFGCFYNLKEIGGTGTVNRSEGPDYKDGYTQTPVIDRPGSLGMTISKPLPFIAEEMERHLHTQEALFCAGEPIVFLVAPASEEAERLEKGPNAEDTIAVLLKPGQVAVLNRGVWHSPAHGLCGETAYYWMAEAYDDEPTVWKKIEHGPVTVTSEGKRC